MKSGLDSSSVLKIMAKAYSALTNTQSQTQFTKISTMTENTV